MDFFVCNKVMLSYNNENLSRIPPGTVSINIDEQIPLGLVCITV